MTKFLNVCVCVCYSNTWVDFQLRQGWIILFSNGGKWDKKKKVSEPYALPGLMCQAISITMIHVDTVILLVRPLIGSVRVIWIWGFGHIMSFTTQSSFRHEESHYRSRATWNGNRWIISCQLHKWMQVINFHSLNKENLMTCYICSVLNTTHVKSD